MANRRDQIVMSTEELQTFLHERHVMNIATIGATGQPHLVAMWYGFLDTKPAFWTFGKSQKIVNLRRDPRITALVEDGDRYEELRGAELVGRAVIVEDYEKVLELGLSVGERYNGPTARSDAARPFLEAQARKRVAVVIEVDKVVSWDHRKLGGSY
jgi:PPOX class probable F420-dependent enzyme